jgi:hypothetical protein
MRDRVRASAEWTNQTTERFRVVQLGPNDLFTWCRLKQCLRILSRDKHPRPWGKDFGGLEDSPGGVFGEPGYFFDEFGEMTGFCGEWMGGM